MNLTIADLKIVIADYVLENVVLKNDIAIKDGLITQLRAEIEILKRPIKQDLEDRG